MEGAEALLDSQLVVSATLAVATALVGSFWCSSSGPPPEHHNSASPRKLSPGDSLMPQDEEVEESAVVQPPAAEAPEAGSRQSLDARSSDGSTASTSPNERLAGLLYAMSPTLATHRLSIDCTRISLDERPASGRLLPFNPLRRRRRRQQPPARSFQPPALARCSPESPIRSCDTPPPVQRKPPCERAVEAAPQLRIPDEASPFVSSSGIAAKAPLNAQQRPETASLSEWLFGGSAGGDRAGDAPAGAPVAAPPPAPAPAAAAGSLQRSQSVEPCASSAADDLRSTLDAQPWRRSAEVACLSEAADPGRRGAAAQASGRAAAALSSRLPRIVSGQHLEGLEEPCGSSAALATITSLSLRDEPDSFALHEPDSFALQVTDQDLKDSPGVPIGARHRGRMTFAANGASFRMRTLKPEPSQRPTPSLPIDFHHSASAPILSPALSGSPPASFAPPDNGARPATPPPPRHRLATALDASPPPRPSSPSITSAISSYFWPARAPDGSGPEAAGPRASSPLKGPATGPAGMATAAHRSPSCPTSAPAASSVLSEHLRQVSLDAALPVPSAQPSSFTSYLWSSTPPPSERPLSLLDVQRSPSPLPQPPSRKAAAASARPFDGTPTKAAATPGAAPPATTTTGSRPVSPASLAPPCKLCSHRIVIDDPALLFEDAPAVAVCSVPHRPVTPVKAALSSAASAGASLQSAAPTPALAGARAAAPAAAVAAAAPTRVHTSHGLCLGGVYDAVDTPSADAVRGHVPDHFLFHAGALLGEDGIEERLAAAGLPPALGSEASLLGVPSEPTNGASQSWAPMLTERDDARQLQYSAEKRLLRNGHFVYRTSALFLGCSAAQLRRFNLDDDLNLTWNTNTIEYRRLSEGDAGAEAPAGGPASNGAPRPESALMYMRCRFPGLFCPREYVSARRVWHRPSDGGCYVVNCSRPIPAADGIYTHRTFRVDDYVSAFVVRDVETDAGRGVELKSVYFESPGVNPMFMNVAIQKGLWSAVQTHAKHFQAYVSALNSSENTAQGSEAYLEARRQEIEHRSAGRSLQALVKLAKPVGWMLGGVCLTIAHGALRQSMRHR